MEEVIKKIQELIVIVQLKISETESEELLALLEQLDKAYQQAKKLIK